MRYVPLPWLHQVRVGGRILVALSGWSYANALALLPGDERPSRIDPATLDDWTGGWVAQLAAPSAERLGAGAEQILWDVSTGSQARTAALPGGGWSVVQRGPVRLWDRVEHAARRWQESGAPEQGRGSASRSRPRASVCGSAPRTAPDGTCRSDRRPGLWPGLGPRCWAPRALRHSTNRTVTPAHPNG